MIAPLVLAAIGLVLSGRREARSRPSRLPRIGGRPATRAAAAGLGLAVALVVGGPLRPASAAAGRTGPRSCR